jgi:hypothetical protein
VIARRSVWSDPEVQELASNFAACADDVGALQRGEGELDRFFQRVAEQGHYAGRTQPTNTRQGIYAFAPCGAFLGSINTRSPQAVATMLREALAKWEDLPEEHRYPARLPAQWTWADLYPEDGLVLRVYSRDLPRDESELPGDWRAEAWNQDFAWFRKAEARQFLPQKPEPGAARDVPKKLVERIATLNLVDNVRGQTPAFRAEHVQEATLSSEVIAVEDGVMRLRLSGRAKLEASGRWRTDGHRDAPEQRQRGADFTLVGEADWDIATERFARFDLLAIGDRWGATQYNGRADDPGPAPMGVLFTITGEPERVPPAYIWSYGWR